MINNLKMVTRSNFHSIRLIYRKINNNCSVNTRANLLENINLIAFCPVGLESLVKQEIIENLSNNIIKTQKVIFDQNKIIIR